MSYARHDAIIVTACYDDPSGRHWIDVAHDTAVAIFGSTYADVTAPTEGRLNNVRSFLVAPDGSSEGREESDAGDAARQEFLNWLRAQSYGFDEDDYEGSPLSWIAVSFGEEEYRPARIVADDSELAGHAPAATING